MTLEVFDLLSTNATQHINIGGMWCCVWGAVKIIVPQEHMLSEFKGRMTAFQPKASLHDSLTKEIDSSGPVSGYLRRPQRV